LKKVARGYLIIGAASFNNSLGLIKSGPDALQDLALLEHLRLHFHIIWFAACDKLGILLLESSISDCFEKYILNKFAFSISSNIKLSLWKIGGILISDPFIPEIYLSMFHQFLQEEFMLVICLIKSLLYLSLAFLTELVTSFLIFLDLFQSMGLLTCFAFL
jgi:hypothetical protein